MEVARGPFSSLYGGNAMGGVVNILTRPVDQRQIEVEGQYGTYRSAEYTLRYSERFWKKLGVAASYQRQQYGGYSTNDIFASPTVVSSATAPAYSRAGIHADHHRRFALRGWAAGRQLVQPARLSKQTRLHVFRQDDRFAAIHLAALWVRLRRRNFADSRRQRATHARPARSSSIMAAFAASR